MPKIDFKDLVSNILVEQDFPGAQQQEQIYKILTNILKKHDDLDYSNNKFANNDTELSKIYTVVGGTNYVADKDVKNNMSDVRVIDILQRLYDATENKKNTAGTWDSFKDQLNNPKNAEIYYEILNSYQKIIQSLTLENKDNWPILHVQVKRAYEHSINEVASLGEKALEGDLELSNSSVIDAVQKIVNRRIGVFTRIAKLKNPKQPFTNLINDIFKTPELYLTGSKKYSSDFAAIDQLYIQDLIKIAIAAKEFYAAEVTRLKTQISPKQSSDQQQTQTNQSPQNLINPNQEFYDSLSLYDKFVSGILTEMPVSSYTTSTGTFDQGKYNTWFDQKLKQAGQEPESERVKQLAQQEPEQQSKSINPSVIKQLKDKALQDVRNRMNFLTGIPVQYIVVDENGRDTDQKGVIDSSKEYNVGGILKMQTPEAQKLIQALGAIAQYTKKKTGAGERLKQRLGYAQQALGAIAAAGLPGGSGPGGIYQGPG